MSLEQYRTVAKKHPLDGWYKRVDNNGWRVVGSVSSKLDNKFTKIDRSALFLPSRPAYYHHDKQKREVKNTKLKKLNKLRWLQSMYKQGMQEELDAKLKSENMQREGTHLTNWQISKEPSMLKSSWPTNQKTWMSKYKT